MDASHEIWLDFNTELGASRSLVGMDGAEHVRMRRAHVGVCSRKLVEDRVGDLARVTAEADGLFRGMEEAGGTVGTRDLHQLDVIHRVAMETMRLYPLSPVASRSVANSFTRAM